MIDKQLIAIINSGRSVALVGSGPSSEMMYPSWGKLAAAARDAAAKKMGAAFDDREYSQLLSSERFPELFEKATQDLGGMDALLPWLRRIFKPKAKEGQVYKYLARWPFRLYLTTNYDDEIQKHLRAAGEHFTTLTNSQADLASINDSTSRVVCKLHGSLARAEGLILTAAQYREFKVEGSRKYFRDKLVALFSTLAVIVVGHSLTDPDLTIVLEVAREIASPCRPIYMFLADASRADSNKYYREYNIRIISYANQDGQHAQLQHHLRTIDRFVVPRSGEPIHLDQPNSAEIEVASSMLVFAKLALGRREPEFAQAAIRPQVLAFACAETPPGASATSLPAKLVPPTLANTPDIAKRVDVAIDGLSGLGYVTRTGDIVAAAPLGKAKLQEVHSASMLAEDQVFGALESRLKTHVPGILVTTLEKLKVSLKQSLLGVFRKRGLSSASLLFRQTPLDRSDMPEIFEVITRSVADLGDFAARVEFVSFVMDLLAKPNEQQRAYLGRVSQGFFAYHMFGLDPAGSKVRTVLAKETEWICDSNILMPLLALECHSHEFHVDFFRRIRTLGIVPTTTSKLIKEVESALQWAIDMCTEGRGRGTLQRVHEVTRQPGYYENLFIDGFIRGSAKGRWSSFMEYVTTLQATGPDALKKRLAAHGIARCDARDYAGHSSTDDSTIEALTKEIWEARVARDISRGGERQARAEAEVLQIIRQVRKELFRRDPTHQTRAYFVSTSRLLDNMYGVTDGLIAWSPESFYRHLSLLSDDVDQPDQLFSSIMTNYYGYGVQLIDETQYNVYFGGILGGARLSFEKEKAAYLAAVEKDVSSAQLEASFENTPDAQKPDFVEQMAWAVARREEEKRRMAEQAAQVAMARLVEERRKHKTELEELKRTERERQARTMEQEKRRARNAMDPAHLRKRRNQAKKRRKKR